MLKLMESITKEQRTSARRLGLLTFVITPILSAISWLPVFKELSLSQVSIKFIADSFGLAGLGGFLISSFILAVIMSLIGDFFTGVISWLINRKIKLAIITFISALVSQLIIFIGSIAVINIIT